MTNETVEDITAVLAAFQEQLDDLTATMERMAATQQRQQEMLSELTSKAGR